LPPTQQTRYLYDILSNKQIIKNKVPILVACNKQDITPSPMSSTKIRPKLEEEL